MSGKYKIVGIIDGPSVTDIGGYSTRTDKYKKSGIIKSGRALAYAVIPKDGKRAELNKLLAGFDKKKVSIESYDYTKKIITKQFGRLSTTLTMIIVALVSILSISTGALMYLIYVQRSDEFGILSAM